MGKVCSRGFVDFILEKMRECVRADNFVVLPRDVNSDFITEYAITEKKQRAILMGLTTEDYSESDPSEKAADSYVHLFGSQMKIDDPFENTKTIEIYIKFEIIEKPYGSRTVFISFHEASFPLQHPYRFQ